MVEEEKVTDVLDIRDMLPKVQSEEVHHVGTENVVEKAYDGPDESGGMFDNKAEDLALDRQVEA